MNDSTPILDFFRYFNNTIKHNVEDETLLKIKSEILMLYTSPNRIYHNINHILSMLNLLEELTKKGGVWEKYCSKKDLKLLKIAIIFHDVIYIPEGDFNEEMSAKYAKNVLKYLKYKNADILQVIEMIYSTKVYLHYDVNIYEGSPLNIMHDLDFRAFSLPWDLFVQTQKNVINEFKIIGQDFKYFRNHWYKYLLKQLSENRKLYCTKYAQENWEPTAIENLKRIVKLESL